ncbi:MAG TPA: DNA primase [Candidatus Aminicenantes bacterium]|nr:DNA primase [Candidatus Aminicenantes bacterium]
MDTKEQIKRGLSIIDVASLYVQLKPSGKNFKALCPFHSEKTPSFSVMPERNIFHCFGCHKSGDIFTLVQEMENLSFPEAMDFLIERFNLPIERQRREAGSPRPSLDAYVTANDSALRHFRANLLDGVEGKHARDYLAKRGITEATSESFALGYAPSSWDSLLRHLQKDGADLDKAVEIGLLGRGREGRVYDRFRGRIMFPILSESGKIIAFGGRTLFDDSAKYLNSPESPLFHKSRHLYGFHQAREHIRESGRAILVEGYFDVITLHQFGVRNTVAALGTALSGEQVHLLNRYTDEIYLFYDGDNAGVHATLRGVECMLTHNVSPRVMDCGKDKDPDDFVRSKGARGVEERIATAEDGFRFLLNHFMEEMDPRHPEHKRGALDQVLRVVNEISDPIVRQEYRRRTADAFQVDLHHLPQRHVHSPSVSNRESRQPLLISPSEKEFLQSLLASPAILSEIRPLLQDELVNILTCRNLLRQLMQRYNGAAQCFEQMDGIWKDLSGPEAALLQEMLLAAQEIPVDQEANCRQVHNCFLSFQERLNKARIREINARIRVAERDNNSAEALRLMQQKSQYLKKKYKVSKEEPFEQKGARESIR